MIDINLYIFALMNKEKNQLNLAIEILIKILNVNPFFWSAWIVLCKILIDNAKENEFKVLKRINKHWILNFVLPILLNANTKTHEKFENKCYDIC